MQETTTVTRRRTTGLALAVIAATLAVAAACGGDSQASQTAAAALTSSAAATTASPSPTMPPLYTATAGQAAASPSAPSVAPTGSAATVAPAPPQASPSASSSPAPTATPAPVRAPTSATTAPTAPVNAAIPNGGAIITVSAGTKARYLVKEQLAGRSLPNDAIGETPDVAGSISFGADGAVQAGSSITVKTTTLKSDESRRDNYLRTSSLETSRYPEVKIAPKSVEGLPWPLPASGQVSFKLTGDLTVHGQVKAVTWDVTALLDADRATGKATTRFKFGDFGMSVPRVFVVLSVEDDIRLEMDFVVTVARG